MKKLNANFKVYVLVLITAVIVTSCLKTEDPYAAYTPEREAGLIKDWLTTMVNNKKDIDTTSTGIYYIVDKVGTGETVKTGNTVTVKYSGRFMDGSVFDSSDKFVYVHKNANQRMIQGWEEGIEVLQKGGSATFLIPSAKAYDTGGYGPIPPNSPLIFLIEVVDIK